METQGYKPLDTGWQDDKRYRCCKEDPTDTPSGCDCCYDSWTEELKSVNLEYSQVNEQAKQVSENYKLLTEERDKLKAWLDDLDKTDQLAIDVCSKFDVMIAQTEKICINSENSVKAIEILFCMIRDLFEQLDLALVIYNQIENCIKCLNSEYLPENSGIRKCLAKYLEKLQAVIKTRNEIIKAIIKVVRDANVLHEGICFEETGLIAILSEWEKILKCGTTGNGGGPSDPCAEQVKNNDETMKTCLLWPMLSLPINKDNYYTWVKNKYDQDKTDAQNKMTELTEINKKKEALAACQASLMAAINEVKPAESSK